MKVVMFVPLNSAANTHACHLLMQDLMENSGSGWSFYFRLAKCSFVVKLVMEEKKKLNCVSRFKTNIIALEFILEPNRNYRFFNQNF